MFPAFLLNKPRLRPRPDPATDPVAAPAGVRALTVRALTMAEVPVPVEVRASARARRMSLRVDAARNLVQVVVPPGIGDGDVMRFVGRHLDWVHKRLGAIPTRQPFIDGAVIPVLGVAHTIRHDPARRGARVARGEDGRWEIRVGGEPEFLDRRVETYLKDQAKRLLAARAREKAARIGAVVAGVTVRDTRSRWGSCSSTGRLSFSWRLIFTPEPVFDYVVAHEVAHLKEMNHSARFWSLCARLTAEVEGPRDWLRANGAKLHRYG